MKRRLFPWVAGDRCDPGALCLFALSAAITIASGPARAFPQSGVAATEQTAQAQPSPATKTQLVAAYGRLPLAFEANQGQTDSQVKFLARGAGYTLFLTGDEAVLSLRKPVPQRSLF